MRIHEEEPICKRPIPKANAKYTRLMRQCQRGLEHRPGRGDWRVRANLLLEMMIKIDVIRGTQVKGLLDQVVTLEMIIIVGME